MWERKEKQEEDVEAGVQTPVSIHKDINMIKCAAGEAAPRLMGKLVDDCGNARRWAGEGGGGGILEMR